jgi:hypothetical protein
MWHRFLFLRSCGRVVLASCASSGLAHTGDI